MDGQIKQQKKQQTEDQRKADLEMKIRHRVSCEARAFDIVNRLLENSITEDYLKEACQYISRSHYQDVVEERAIACMCGYPLCDSPLKNVPKKKYHISTKSNRVYDITERKNFCSNQCYKASKHLQKQVPDTPVWSRENEPRVNYDLLPTSGTRGELGEEVIGGNQEYLKDEVLALERLDHQAEQARDGSAAKKKSTKDISKQTPESAVPTGQRLVAQPIPVSSDEQNEEDLSEKMVQLSVKEQSSDQMLSVEKARSETSVDLLVQKSSSATDVSLMVEKSSSATSSGAVDVSLAVEKSSSATNVNSVVQKSNSGIAVCDVASNNAEGDSSVLESSMKKLALTESSMKMSDDIVRSDIDSDDDEVEDSEGHSEGKVMEETSIFLTELSHSASERRENVRPFSAEPPSTQKTGRRFRSKSAKLRTSADEQTLVPSKDADVESVSSIVRDPDSETEQTEVDVESVGCVMRGADSETKQFQTEEHLRTEQTEDLQAGLLQPRDSAAALPHPAESAQTEESRTALQHPEQSMRPRESAGSMQLPEESAQHRESTAALRHPGKLAQPRDSTQALQQQPRESKTAYLMRLLDRRRDLLATIADIQPASQVEASTAESKPAAELKTSSESKILADSKTTNESNSVVESGTKSKPDNSGNFERGSLSQSSTTSSGVLKEVNVAKKSPTEINKNKAVNSDPNQSHPKTENNPVKKATEVKISPLEAVCRIVQQWMTPETLTYLHVRPSEEEGQGQSSVSSKFHSDPEVQRKYQNLCQRLAGQEKDFDEILGEEEVGSEEEGDRRRPMPRFEELAQQTAEYQLRVTEFLRGPAPQKKKEKQEPDEDVKSQEASSTRPVVLPAVDSHNQQLIRRRIVLDRLNRSVSALLPSLGLSVQDVSGVLRELVFTLSFSSHNIIFKPAEWSLVSLVLLNMLAYKSSEVASAFQSGKKTAMLDAVLKRLGHSSASLSQLVRNMLTDAS